MDGVRVQKSVQNGARQQSAVVVLETAHQQLRMLYLQRRQVQERLQVVRNLISQLIAVRAFRTEHYDGDPSAHEFAGGQKLRRACRIALMEGVEASAKHILERIERRGSFQFGEWDDRLKLVSQELAAMVRNGEAVSSVR